MEQGTKDLALNSAVTEALLLVEELKELKVNLSLELQAVRHQRVAEAREWREFIEEMRRELTGIRFQFRQEATLLHLIRPEADEKQAGEEAWEPKRRRNHPQSSSLSSTLRQFAKSTG